jgi:hypothetical protein
MIRFATPNRAHWLHHRSAIAAIFTIILLMSIAAAAQTPCARVTVTADQPVAIFNDGFETGTKERWKDLTPNFRATEILDIIFEVEIEGELQELQVLTLEIIGPNGHLFRELAVPVATKSDRSDGKVLLDGFPYPVRLAKLSSEGMVEVRFPVAGTTIVSSSVYGTWSVAPLINGTSSSCDAESVHFVLVP